MPELEYHPIADMFPMIAPDELRKLAADIKENGLREPIVLYENKILDGRNRYQVCLTENVEPAFAHFTGPDPLAFVVSMNLHRRHLNLAQQKAIIKQLAIANPQRSDQSIAKEVGVSDKTVAAVREKMAEDDDTTDSSHWESEVGTLGLRHSENPSVSTEGSGTQQPTDEPKPKTEPPPRKPRVDTSGRLAGGPKPKTKQQKAAAKQQKETKPKSLTNERDEWVNAVSARFKADPERAAQDLVMTMTGYDVLLRQRLTLAKRKELVRKFASALDVKLTLDE